MLAFCVLCQQSHDISSVFVFPCGHACTCRSCMRMWGSITEPCGLRSRCPVCCKAGVGLPLRISVSIGPDLRCRGCGRGDDEDTLLLCDSHGCPDAWHMHCLPFPLLKKPKRNACWYCPLHEMQCVS